MDNRTGANLVVVRLRGGWKEENIAMLAPESSTRGASFDRWCIMIGQSYE